MEMSDGLPDDGYNNRLQRLSKPECTPREQAAIDRLADSNEDTTTDYDYEEDMLERLTGIPFDERMGRLAVPNDPEDIAQEEQTEKKMQKSLYIEP